MIAPILLTDEKTREPEMTPMIVTSLLLGLATAVSATEADTRGATALQDIGQAEWSDLTSGRTLSYSIDGEIWAREYYDPNSDRVVLKLNDGTCMNGRWEFSEPLFCFHWDESGTACFRHVRFGDEILVLETDNGVENGAVQVVEGISNLAPDCSGDLTS